MKSEKKKCGWSKRKTLVMMTTLVIIMSIVYLVYQSLWFTRVLISKVAPSIRSQIYLSISEIDHEKLLEACRKEIARREIYPQAVLSSDNDIIPGRVSPQLDDPRFSPAIRELHPFATPLITSNKLRIDLRGCDGNCAHYGIVAFAPGVVPTAPNDLIDKSFFVCRSRDSLVDGMVEIIPGLWFYDGKMVGRPKVRRLFIRLIQKSRAIKRKEEVVTETP